LWKLTSCGKLLRTFPQDLENASRFPHLPQPLPATRNKEIEGVSCPSTGVHHVPGHLSTMSPVQTGPPEASSSSLCGSIESVLLRRSGAPLAVSGLPRAHRRLARRHPHGDIA